MSFATAPSMERATLVMKLGLAVVVFRCATLVVYDAYFGATTRDQLQSTQLIALLCSGLWLISSVFHGITVSQFEGALDFVFAFLAWLFARLLSEDIKTEARLATRCRLVQLPGIRCDQLNSPQLFMIMFSAFLFVGASCLAARVVVGWMIIHTVPDSLPPSTSALSAKAPRIADAGKEMSTH
ncbi:hypothetical protein EXIGLDRAFT_694122 [Exidia glandulosa HHB12029]|uniref:Uncharacterized protein n=1 Tax=Exidia glandulosa HHB12029 TaxID=1314781 RepID=A0A165GUQ3_EXIGL|nr:hypothetical protein EXIGLDRAFT_694122 [Exidia glandulosa HHB12029]